MDNVELLRAKDAIFRLIGQYCRCFSGADDDYYMSDRFESALERSFIVLGFDRDEVPLMEFCQAWEDNNRKLWTINLPNKEYRGPTAQEYYDIFVKSYYIWVDDNSEDAEYISREDLKNDIAKSTEPFNTASVFRAINRQIAADVVPVVHGQWIGAPLCGNENCKCSNCGSWHNIHVNLHGEITQKYCPSCGAKMDKGKE